MMLVKDRTSTLAPSSLGLLAFLSVLGPVVSSLGEDPAHWLRRDSATVLVIGSPGHGKSTFLNSFGQIDDENAEDIFEVGAGADSCTKETSSKVIEVKYDDGSTLGRIFSLNLVDSPGFPDPDESSAVAMYDSVVRAASAPLNAVIWIVKGERGTHTVFDSYKMLMREFNNLGPPIFMVVNDRQSPYKENQKGQDKRKKDYDANLAYGKLCSKQTGVSIQRFFVSNGQAELTNVSKQVFMAALVEEPKASNLKTFQQLRSELEDCKTKDDLVRLESRKLHIGIAKAEEAKKTNENVLAWAAVAVTAATVFAPYVGSVSMPAMLLLQNELTGQNEELASQITQKKQDVRALPKDTRATVKRLIKEAGELFKALTGKESDFVESMKKFEL